MNLLSYGTFGVGILDVVIVLAVVIFAIFGWKNGFLVKMIELASGLFGLLASFILARPFSTVLATWIGEPINVKIGEYLAQSDLFAATLNEANVRTAFAGMSLPTFMVDWIVESIDFDTLTTSIIDAIQPTILSLALVVIAFITLFFGSMIVFFILKLLAKGITKIPVIREIDKVLGVLFGIIKVAAIVYILLFVLALLLTIPSINNMIGEFLTIDMKLGEEEFRLSKWLYDNNILKQVIDVFI